MRKFLSVLLTSILLLTSFTLAIDAVNPDIKVETAKIEKAGDNFNLKIIYPVFSGFKAAEQLNDSIQNKNITSAGCFGDVLSALQDMIEQYGDSDKSISEKEIFLDKNFDCNISDNILSVIFNEDSYYGGAHGIYSKDSITLNTKTGRIYTFNTLFNQTGNYKQVVADKINAMIDKEKDLYFENAKETVAAMDTDFQFYIDGNNLVIYFNLYELRPYAGGMPEFTIPAAELKGLLKDEVYNQIIDAKPLEKVRMNGSSLSVPYELFNKDSSLMLPLRFFSELLGKTVDWNPHDGAIIEGGYVKQNINSYYTEATKNNPKKLATAPVLINNRLFVPIEYFSQVLNEEVSYDGEVIRVLGNIAKNEDWFNTQIVDFRLPTSGKQAAEMYAQAVKERMGAIQYALFSEELRAKTKANFEEMNWVTGVSSPWVTEYDIKNTGTDTYDIVFQWATSMGKAGDSTVTVKVERIPEREYWQITDVER